MPINARMPHVGDLVKWMESGSTERAGILLDVMEERGHYLVFKVLMLSGDIAMIRYMSEFPETISKHSSA